MRPLMLIAVLGVAACTQPSEPPGAAFSRQLAGKVAGPPQLCVTSYSAENLRIIDRSTIAYGNGPTTYVNRLASPCPGLSQFNTIIVDAADGKQYCRGNRVRGLAPGGNIPGPWCTLGDWVPYNTP